MDREYHVTETMVPLSFEYKYRVGQALERFLNGLAEKRILGARCGNCNSVTVPPRTLCGRCRSEVSDWVEVGPEGVVENYSLARISIVNGDIVDAEEAYVVGQIRLDGADSLLTAKVVAKDLESVSVGIRVRAVFATEPAGTVRDLDHFEPIG